jgi:hypothetical protein
MATHWRMNVDAMKFNTPSQQGSDSKPHQSCLSVAQIVSRSDSWSRYQVPAHSWLCIITLHFSLDQVSYVVVPHVNIF